MSMSGTATLTMRANSELSTLDIDILVDGTHRYRSGTAQVDLITWAAALKWAAEELTQAGYEFDKSTWTQEDANTYTIHIRK